MSASNAIGTGAVVITADADPMAAGLAKAAADLNRWSAQAQAVAKRSEGLGDAAFEKLTHGFDRKMNHLIAGAWIMPLVSGIHAAAEGIFHLASGAEEFAEAMERGRRLAEESVAAFREASTSVLGNKAAGVDALRQALEQAEKNKLGVEGGLHAARDRAEGKGMSEFFSPEVLKVVKEIPVFGRGVEADFKAAKDHVAEMEKRFKVSEEAAKKIKDRLREAQYPQHSDKVRDFVKESIERLTDEGVAAGKTAGEMDALRAARMGANAAQQEEIRDAGKFREGAVAQADLMKQVDDTTRAFELQARTLGMTSEEAELFKLKMAGANDETVAGAKKWLEASAAIRVAFAEIEKPKAAGAFLAGSREAYSATVSHQLENLPGFATDDNRKQLQEIIRLRVIAEKALDAVKANAPGAF